MHIMIARDVLLLKWSLSASRAASRHCDYTGIDWEALLMSLELDLANFCSFLSFLTHEYHQYLRDRQGSCRCDCQL